MFGPSRGRRWEKRHQTSRLARKKGEAVEIKFGTWQVQAPKFAGTDGEHQGLAEFGMTNETFRAHLGGRLPMSCQTFAPFSIPNSARLVHWVV